MKACGYKVKLQSHKFFHGSMQDRNHTGMHKYSARSDNFDACLQVGNNIAAASFADRNAGCVDTKMIVNDSLEAGAVAADKRSKLSRAYADRFDAVAVGVADPAIVQFGLEGGSSFKWHQHRPCSRTLWNNCALTRCEMNLFNFRSGHITRPVATALKEESTFNLD